MIKNKLDSKFWAEGEQNWYYEAFYAATADWPIYKKLRVYIRDNAYAFQSFGRVEIWDQETRKWNLIASLPGELLATKGTAHHREFPKELFAKDEAELLRLAEMVLED